MWVGVEEGSGGRGHMLVVQQKLTQHYKVIILQLKEKLAKHAGYIIVTLEGSCRRQWHPTPVLLPGKSHGQRSLVSCNPWGR